MSGIGETRPYEDVLREVREQHPEESPEQQEARARYRIEQHVDRRPQKTVTSGQWRVTSLPWWVIAWGVALLLLLGAIAAKAEPDERLRLIHRAMTAEASGEPQQPSGLILQLRNQGTVLTTRPAGLLILNCSTNMSCSMTGSTFNITSSSTASTAFSALTASLNTNVGTFSASGNSWDFTAATLFKLRAGAALTTSAAGDLGYDTTAGRWHGFIGAADRLFIGSTNVGVAGQAALSNADGTFTFADPIVSGPAAEGAAPVNNPVWVAGKGADGFIHSVRMANDGTVRVDPTGTTTQPISAASLPLPTGAAQEHATAASPHAARLTDGTAFYKATTPADTQPISAASLPLPTGAATETTLSALNTKINTEITEDYDTGAGTQTMKKFGIALPASGGSVAGGTATNPLRTDPTGTTTQPVSGTVTGNQGAAAAGSGAWPVTITDTANTVVKPGDATNNAIRVNIIAGAGSGGTAAADNSVFTGGTTNVTPMGALFDATPPAITDGNIGAPRMNSSRQLLVECASGCTAGGSFADSSAFTFTTTPIGIAGAVVDDTATNTVAENSAGAPRMNTNRILYSNLRNDAGTEVGTATTPFQVSLANTGANATAVKVDGSAVTQPVSGTVTANAGTNLNTSALALEATLGRAQGSTTSGQTGPIVQGAVTTSAPTYTTAQTNPLSLNTSGGLRVDGSGVTQPVSGTVTVGTFPDNEPFNVAQINGVTPLMGNGVTGTGSPRVTLASDNSNSPGIGGSGTGAAVPSAARYVGGRSGANLEGFERCDSSAFLNMSTATTTEIVALTASQSIRVCSYRLISGGVANVKFVRGTGVNCATGPADVSANFPFIANTGMAANGGSSPIYVVASANALCVTSSAAVTVAVEVSYTKF